LSRRFAFFTIRFSDYYARDVAHLDEKPLGGAKREVRSSLTKLARSEAHRLQQIERRAAYRFHGIEFAGRTRRHLSDSFGLVGLGHHVCVDRAAIANNSDDTAVLQRSSEKERAGYPFQSHSTTSLPPSAFKGPRGSFGVGPSVPQPVAKKSFVRARQSIPRRFIFKSEARSDLVDQDQASNPLWMADGVAHCNPVSSPSLPVKFKTVHPKALMTASSSER
jgi:hypothetical protein